PLAAAMFALLVLLGLVTEGFYRVLGPLHLLWLALAVFAVAWIGQFAGHGLEGRRPSFATDLVYLLVGPAWLMAKLLRRLGISY
ncbi:MAG TPA: Mpo1-like protein, partial [Rhodanobacteraceae bacterium]|nr:Mpo1-like protein [Rhodanobacteraceae bacterium]